MSKFNNGLTDAQAERIAYLMEECAEVIQICGKILRHGLHSTNPVRDRRGGYSPTNQVLLEFELSDVRQAEYLLSSNGDVSDERISDGFRLGPRSRYFHHQGQDEEGGC